MRVGLLKKREISPDASLTRRWKDSMSTMDQRSRVRKRITTSFIMSRMIESQDMQMLETGKGLKSRRDLIGATIILFDRRHRNPDRNG